MNAEELKLWRKNIGLNQSEVARKMGISQAAYALLESGRYEISRRTELSCLAISYGLDEKKEKEEEKDN